jgi:hypothetical protein
MSETLADILIVHLISFSSVTKMAVRNERLPQAMAPRLAIWAEDGGNMCLLNVGIQLEDQSKLTSPGSPQIIQQILFSFRVPDMAETDHCRKRV